MKRVLCLILGLMICCGLYSAAAEGMENFEFADKIPDEYLRRVDEGGTTAVFNYPTKDYTGDGAEITKYAVIYLPPDYSEDNQYDLLILCHGIGGSETEWGFLSDFCIGKNALDHLIVDGVIPPMIVVMPNGRSTANYKDSSMNNAASFYNFSTELRTDLLPYIDSHYATYGSLTPDDLTAARDHRYMAGLSMGGMQTINIGLCECLDLFSAFGAFSAAPTSYTSAEIAEKIKQFEDYPIRFFYSVCGLQDGTAYASASAAAKNLPQYSDRFTEENWLWQECAGVHDFRIWYLGLYNFLRILGS